MRLRSIVVALALLGPCRLRCHYGANYDRFPHASA